MRHLAQVQQDEITEHAMLRLLAVQKTEYTWVVLPNPTEIVLDKTLADLGYAPQSLVMVDVSDTQDIQHLEDALPWVLQMISEYLTKGLSPTSLQEEAERAEQWRQSLTLRDQELGRRTLELEARRDQIQELEKNLQENKDKLEGSSPQAKVIPKDSPASDESA